MVLLFICIISVMQLPGKAARCPFRSAHMAQSHQKPGDDELREPSKHHASCDKAHLAALLLRTLQLQVRLCQQRQHWMLQQVQPDEMSWPAANLHRQ